MNADVTKFLKSSKQWSEEMTKLRALVLSTRLEENLKWGLPCYAYHEKNIVIIQPFKNFLALMFFKGSLLKDTKKILKSNGPNSQAARRFEFQSSKDVSKAAALIKSYIKEAIALEEAGQKVSFKEKTHALPEELKRAFSKNTKLKKAFAMLTPGRQRAYILYFSGAKQSITRQSRIDKYTAKILAGKGMIDK